MGVPMFTPKPVVRQKPIVRTLTVDLDSDTYDRIKSLSHENDLSMRAFVRQAVSFALQNYPSDSK